MKHKMDSINRKIKMLYSVIDRVHLNRDISSGLLAASEEYQGGMTDAVDNM